MGRVYYISPDQIDQVHGLKEQGPDVLDDAPSFDEFKARLQRYRGEVKGILTRGFVLSGHRERLQRRDTLRHWHLPLSQAQLALR